ncbi:hypothetical protein GFS31_23910 [Leptolyngbya sp. BL0902]|nr:hypothetical protein GFS31_23910 [Leptolyngbya sp. BL0902]
MLALTPNPSPQGRGGPEKLLMPPSQSSGADRISLVCVFCDWAADVQTLPISYNRSMTAQFQESSP